MARRKRNQTTENQGAQSTLPPAVDERLDVPMLETWLWDAACAIRGATDAPKFKGVPNLGERERPAQL